MKLTLRTKSGPIVIDAEPGARLDDLVLAAGVLLDRPCGGRGTCGKCMVKVSGHLSPLSEAEKKHLSDHDLESGHRLACQVTMEGDCEVEIEGGAVFTDKTFARTTDLAEVPGDLGMAIDLGTTTVAAFLCGLDTGRVYAGNAVLNRQAVHGAEVMSRLMVAHSDPEELKRLAWETMAEAAAGLQLSGDEKKRVTSAVVVCNSAMHHLALGLPVDKLMQHPFEPTECGPSTTNAPALSKLLPSLGQVSFAPLIGGFVGSDALACLMYFNLGRQGERSLAVDLGTNGEVLLAGSGRVMAASTAAGPAFEGVNISCGMRALDGAVTKVWHEDGAFKFDSIGSSSPCGLTGSGLLSAINCLRKLGAIDETGRMAGPGEVAGVEIRIVDECKNVILAEGLALTQPDVRELQKAKGAIRAAVEILMNRAGLEAAELDRVVLTGSFGGRVAPQDVLDLGVLPSVDPAKILSIPNGAGFGAAMMLDPAEFERAGSVAGKVEHVELNLDPAFMELYVDSMILS